MGHDNQPHRDTRRLKLKINTTGTAARHGFPHDRNMSRFSATFCPLASALGKFLKPAQRMIGDENVS
jgi:hypothetical protein